MADKFSTTPNNFAKNTKDKSPTKYLDLAGLIVFFDKLREYIEDSDKKLNGSNIKMYAGQLGENNPTITGQIESLWAFLGEGELEGSIAANVAAILGQYVKHMKTPSAQNLPLKLNITEGADGSDEKDIYTISLVDNGLNDHIEDFDTNRVKSLTPANSGGSVSLSVNKNKGDVTITINSQELTDKVADLEGGRIKSVSEGTSVENFVDLGVSTTNNVVTITINDENLANEIGDIWTSVKNRVQDVNFTNTNTGTKYVTVSCTDDTNASAEGKQTNLTIDDTAVTEKFASVDSALKDRVQDVNFTNTNTGTKYVTVSCTDDSDSNNTNGRQTNLTIDDTAVAEALADRVQDINAENSNTGTKYVTISCTDDTNTSAVGKQTKITINDSALATKLSDHTTAIADRVQDVNAENSNTGTKYVTISCTDDTNTSAAGKQTKITIDDTAVTEKFASVDSTLKNRVQDVNFTNTNTGAKYVTVSCTDDSDSNNTNGKQTNLTIDDTAVAEALADRVQDINFTNTNTGTKYVTVSCTDDSNSTTVGKQTNLTINDTAVAEALADRVQDVNVENANTGTKYVTISCTDDSNSTTVGKQTKITINDSNLTAAIEDIRSIISGMGQVVEIKGVLTSLPSTTDGYGNGDVVIVGNEEYICYESKWYLFGHTSELAEDYNAHTHSYTPEGTVSSSFTGTKATLTSSAPLTGTGQTPSTSVNSITGKGSLPTYETLVVADDAHTHSISYKPAGSVSSEFTGTKATLTSSAPLTGTGQTPSTSVNSITGAGSLPTYKTLVVSDDAHTHSITYTPAGSVPATATTGTSVASTSHKHSIIYTPAGSFSGTQATISVPKTGTTGVSVASTAHKHSVTHTPAGLVSSSFTGTQATISVPKTSTSGTSVASTAHKHSITYTPAGSFSGTQATISVPKTGTSGVSVASTAHKHSITYTPAGSFSGTQATISVPKTGTTAVTVATKPSVSYSAGTLTITLGTTTVASNNHTHSATYTPAGSVSSSFTGTKATLTSGTPTADSGSSASTTVAANAHTHSVTYTPAGSVSSSFTGTQATLTSGAPLTGTGYTPSTTVAANAHTHSATYTPAGTFTGTQATLTSGAPLTGTGYTPSTTVAAQSHTHSFTGTQATLTAPASSATVSVNSITGKGSLPTYTTVDVASTTHKHSVEHTPAGSVSSTFSGTQATLTAPASSSTVSVNSMTGKGSLPTYTTVDVASTTHKHSVEHTPAGSVSSSFTGKNKSTSGPSITTPVADEVKP